MRKSSNTKDKLKIVLITGATGLLGSSLALFLSSQENIYVVKHGHNYLADINGDLCDVNTANHILEKTRPDIVINAAGLTDVDLCERDPQLAYLVNVKIPQNICRWMRKNSASHLIQISTDQVYDGAGPHEEDAITLRNCYAFSKYCAELAVSCGSTTVLRTNFFGRSMCDHRSSFSDWAIDNLSSGKSLKLFTDVYFSPILITTLQEMILRVMQNPNTGVFNLGSKDGMSKRNFVHMLAEHFGLASGNCKDIKSADIDLDARRPKDMRMNSGKFEEVFGVELPSLSEEIMSLKGFYDGVRERDRD